MFCRRWDGDLATVRDFGEEVEMVWGEEVWIGLSGSGGRERWSDGDESSYRNIRGKNKKKRKLCFVKTKNQWKGISCQAKRKFICQRNVIYKGWLDPVTNYSAALGSLAVFLTCLLCCCAKKPILKDTRNKIS